QPSSPPALLPRSLHDALPIYDLPLEVVPGARGRTKRRRRIVIRVHAAQALGARMAVVAAIRAGIAGVGHLDHVVVARLRVGGVQDRKSTRLNSSHQIISYAVF